jgi:hypothetical protein
MEKTLAIRTKPGPFFQLYIWVCVFSMHILNIKTAQLKGKTLLKQRLGSLPLAFVPLLQRKKVFKH